MYAFGLLIFGIVDLAGSGTSVAAFQEQPSALHHRANDGVSAMEYTEAPVNSPDAPEARGREQDRHTHAVDAVGSRSMGFDQQAVTHHFILTGDGGRIELTANRPSDEGSKQRVRAHLAHIAARFSEGDFSIPRMIHGEDPPGVDTMTRLKLQIHYEVVSLQEGGSLRIFSASQEAISGLHAFLRYQIHEHHTGDSLRITNGMP